MYAGRGNSGINSFARCSRVRAGWKPPKPRPGGAGRLVGGLDQLPDAETAVQPDPVERYFHRGKACVPVQ